MKMAESVSKSGVGVPEKEFEFLRNEVEKELDSCREMAVENRSAIVRLETLYESMSKFPDAVDSLKGTILELNKNLEFLNYRIDEVRGNVKAHEATLESLEEKDKEIDAYISKIDGKSKVDWQVAITKNFWSILAVLGVLYLAVRDFWEGLS